MKSRLLLLLVIVCAYSASLPAQQVLRQSDIGTAAGTVAAGNDSRFTLATTALQPGAIGATVQSYNANTTLLGNAFGTTVGTFAQGNDARFTLATTAVQPNTAPALIGTNFSGIPASSLPLGTSANTVTAGNDPRLNTVVTPASFVQSGHALGESVAVDTAAFQAAHDSLPTAGGVIAIPSGTFQPLGLNITKPVIFRGSAVGGVEYPGSTVLTTASATAQMFSVTVRGCKFQDLVFTNTATTPTAGAFIVASSSEGIILDSCTFLGGWDQVALQNGSYRHVDRCNFLQYRRYGLGISDDAVPDAGDDEISGCLFSTVNASAPVSAAVHWTSASGLRFLNNKINGGSGSAAGTNGVWVDLRYGPGQMNDFVVTGNSFENVLDSGILVTLDGTNNNTGQGLNSIEITGANQFYNCGVAAITLFRYPNGTTPTANSYRVHIGGAVIHQCPTGIYVGPCNNLKIESDILYGVGVTHPLVIDAAANGYVNAQHRDDAGFLIESPGAGVRVDYRTQNAIFVTSTTPQAVYRCAVPLYYGGRIKVTSSGSLPGVGSFYQVAERVYSRMSSNVTLTTVGTDTSGGAAATQTPIAFDVSTTAGEIRVTQLTSTGNGFQSYLTIDVDGCLTTFKVGG